MRTGTGPGGQLTYSMRKGRPIDQNVNAGRRKKKELT